MDVIVVGVAVANRRPLQGVGVQALALGHAPHVVVRDPVPLAGVQLLALGQRQRVVPHRALDVGA